MAEKGIYIGVDGVARKIRKGYIGIDGIAHKIKKAYIGIGGVARPCWGEGELSYYGVITSLSIGLQYLAATTIGNYALFAGGVTATNAAMPTVNAYSATLIRKIADAMSIQRTHHTATTAGGQYAVISGGASNASYIDYYDTSLTHSQTINAISETRYKAAATPVGNYALVAGGQRSATATSTARNTIEAYDTSLSCQLATNLGAARYRLAATTIGDYAIFSGGYNGSSTLSNTDVYNSSLTRTTVAGRKRYNHAGTTVGNYAVFAGGNDGDNGSTDAAFAYDKSLTLTDITSLLAYVEELKATTVGNYAIFAGGWQSMAYRNFVTVYDESLTRTIPSNQLRYARYGHAATTVGNYALFGGGLSIREESVDNTVEAYTVI